MPRDPGLHIDDIVDAIDKIQQYTLGMSQSEYLADSRTQDAVVCNLAVIGEASRRLVSEMRERAPEIEWQKIVGLRNLLVHEYFGISQEIVWDVVVNKLEALKEACRIMKKE